MSIVSNKAVKRDKAADKAIKKRQQARKMLEIKDMVRDDVVAEFLTAVEKMSAMIDRDPEYMDD